ncbi:MAG TPA: hypothetical protein VGS80_22080, partial [Ktedonobacterales bacterium]|nr:hypothetical protein [Ktedonobacterales bacterium]
MPGALTALFTHPPDQWCGVWKRPALAHCLPSLAQQGDGLVLAGWPAPDFQQISPAIAHALCGTVSRTGACAIVPGRIAGAWACAHCATSTLDTSDTSDGEMRHMAEENFTLT